MDDDEKRTSTHPVLLLSYPLTPVFPVHYFPSAITWTVGSLALGQGIAIKGLTENAVVARREMCRFAFRYTFLLRYSSLGGIPRLKSCTSICCLRAVSARVR